jgi:thiamine kinase-like enzyme
MRATIVGTARRPGRRCRTLFRGNEVICHNDLLGSNVLFRAGRPAAFIDWELAAPGPRAVDLVAPASYWVPLRPDDDAARHGLPTDRRGERLRLLLDGYDLTDREGFLDLIAAVWHSWRDAHSLWGGECRERWWEAYDTGRCDYIDANLAWLEEHRTQLEAWL